MASIDSLTDPQRAVLQLLLKRGKSYGEIATLLKLDESAVQARAHEAVSALGPERPEIGADHRNEVADYLLGQQTASGRAATREYLDDSSTGRTWARAVAGALRPIGGDALPEIPSEPAEVDRAFEALDARAAREQEVAKSSQLGTRIIFGVVGVAVAVVLIVVLGIFGGDDNDKSKTATVTRTAPDASTEVPQAIAQGVLAPPKGTTSAASAQTGIVRYASTNQFKLLVAAKKLPQAPQGTAYGVWLYTKPSKELFVGFPKAPVGSNGDLSVVADLKPSTATYAAVLITLESVQRPTRPGRVVLIGELKIAAATPTQTQPQTTTQPG